MHISTALAPRFFVLFAALLLSACADDSESVSGGEVLDIEQVSKEPAIEFEPARVEQASNDYFGTRLSDSYQWMEKSENSAELKRWMLAQAKVTNDISSADPTRDELYKRLKELLGSASTVFSVQRAGENTFYMYLDESSQTAKLMVRNKEGVSRVLIDPSKFNGVDGEHASLDNYSLSSNGDYVTVNVSSGGGELTDIYFVNTATGERLKDKLTWIWGEFPAVWMPDDSGVLYTRMSRESKTDSSINKMQNMGVYFHELGTAVEDDVPVLGRGINQSIDFLPEEFARTGTVKDSEWTLGFGTGARFESRLFATQTRNLSKGQVKWFPIFEYSDSVESVSLVGDSLYFKTNKGSPNGRIDRLSIAGGEVGAAAPILAEQEGVLTGFVVHKQWLYFSMDLDGKSSLYKKQLSSDQITEIDLPFVGQLSLFRGAFGDAPFHFSLQGWTQPREYFEYLSDKDVVRSIGLRSTSDADFSNVVVEKLEAPSHDGVLVPLTLVYQKGLKKTGDNPTILNGYGGYGISRNPYFNSSVKAWVERGGIYAYAHVRGGGEKGKQWHLDGKGPNKKNGVQDFIACAKYLADEKYTSSSNIAATGGSMGGVLIGRTITEAPQVFDASAIYVGMLNALRYLEAQNGANQTSELMATPETKDGFDILYAMDAYHNIKSGQVYPNTMIVVGLNDQRVAPWESAKFVAKMQAAASKTSLTLLRASEGEGHGIGSTRDQALLRTADVWSFFLREFAAD